MRREDVFVCNPAFDAANGTWVDSVVISDGFIAPCVSENVSYLGIGQLTSPWVCPPFADHIPHVVGSCADEQVIRVDAESDIACVADFHSIRDRAIEDFMSPSVDVFEFPPILAASTDNPVSPFDGVSSSGGPSPDPAVFCNLNLAKPVLKNVIFVHEASISKEAAYA